MREPAILALTRRYLLAYLFSEASASADGVQCETDGRRQAGPAALIDSTPVQLIKHEPRAAPAAGCRDDRTASLPLSRPISYRQSSFSLV